MAKYNNSYLMETRVESPALSISGIWRKFVCPCPDQLSPKLSEYRNPNLARSTEQGRLVKTGESGEKKKGWISLAASPRSRMDPFPLRALSLCLSHSLKTALSLTTVPS